MDSIIGTLLAVAARITVGKPNVMYRCEDGVWYSKVWDANNPSSTGSIVEGKGQTATDASYDCLQLILGKFRDRTALDNKAIALGESLLNSTKSRLPDVNGGTIASGVGRHLVGEGR